MSALQRLLKGAIWVRLSSSCDSFCEINSLNLFKGPLDVLIVDTPPGK